MTNLWLDKTTGEVKFLVPENTQPSGKNIEDYDIVDAPLGYLEGTHNWDPATRTAVLAEPEVICPDQVTPRQFRLALIQADLYTTITDYVSSQGPEVQVAWDYATYIARHDPFIVNSAAALGITDEQADQIFCLAGTL